MTTGSHPAPTAVAHDPSTPRDPPPPPPGGPTLLVDNRDASIGQQVNVTGSPTFGDVHGPVTVVHPPAAPTPTSEPRRPPLALTLAIATTLAAVATLTFTTPGQRIACTAPGLRSLPACNAHNPTLGELTTWNAALSQPSGDGLRRYLRDYPQGLHADEARARLQACTTEHVASLGPERSATTARMPVNRSGSFATEDQALADVELRAATDAQDLCKAYEGKSTTLVSARLELETPSCTQLDGRFSCGAQSTLVCRIRDRISTPHERCNDPFP